MKIKQLLPALTIFIFFTNYIYPQPKNDFILKQSFVPILDSLISAPSNCNEAWTFVMFDSLSGQFSLIQVISDQEKRIQNIISDINMNLNSIKTDKFKMHPEQGNGPPEGGMPPGGMGPPGGGKIPEEFKDVMEDLNDANIAMSKLSEVKEQFKDEITEMQTKVNEKLHKTLETDHETHLRIIDDFMTEVSNLYQKNKRVYRENMNKVDGFIKKYDYGTKIKMPRMRSEILKLQLAQAENLKFLLNITKEFINTGANFYKEKNG